jgi:soluble lytic murein transglycosylase-like protein
MSRSTNNWGRWWSGFVRQREEARLARFRPANAPLMRLSTRIALWLHVCIFLFLLSAFMSVVLAQSIPRDALRYQLTLKREAHQAWGLDAPVAALAGQVHQESHWREAARSPVGAVGLAQFMPATSNWIGGLYPSLGDRAPTNPTWALRALVTYDKWLYDRIKAEDECERMAFALSAYNGGLGWVYKRQKVSTSPGVCFDVTCTINPGIALSSQRENQHYPQVILLTNEQIYSLWGPGACP